MPEIPGEVDVEDIGPQEECTSSFQKYQNEWYNFYNPEYCREIYSISLQGQLRSSRFRSICWQIFLNILPYNNVNDGTCSKDVQSNERENKTGIDEQSSSSEKCQPGVNSLSIVAQWSTHVSHLRKEYDKLKQSFSLDPTLSKQDNPLSQNSESIWNKYFCDKELKKVISQDVIRTFPGLDFFRNESIQELMVSVLFCYARKYPHMCYRQGMHEILAPIIFVLHCDHQALLHALEYSKVDEHLVNILNEKYLEHDAFTIFCQLMSSMEAYYLINDSIPTSSGHFAPQANAGFSAIIDNQAVTQLYYINEHILKPNDPELHVHLYNMKIPLTLFGIRWLRLLFGREFSLQDLLVLWDVIFAEGPRESFELVNYIVVAMLIAIRDQILFAHHSDCLTFLMRYPPGIDVNSIIEHALYLKYPDRYPEFAVQIEPPVSISNTNQISVKTKKKKRLKFPNLSKKKNSRGSDIVEALPVAEVSPSTDSKNSRHPSGSDIVEALPIAEDTGLTLGSQSQLIYYRGVMSKCHASLTQVTNRIETELSRRHNNAVLNQILRDIREVCSLLEVSKMSPPRSLVEVASEANESRLQTPAQSPLPKTSCSQIDEVLSDEAESFPFNLPPPKSSVDMKIFREIDESEILPGDIPAIYPHHL